ncbi:MAG: glycosyltransferase family 4 protein [Candidatus Omnitrophota bacterium]
MKVLLLTTHLNIGGVARYTVNLAQGLKERGIEVYVASSGGDLVDTLNKHSIQHIPVSVNTKFEFNPKLILTLFKLLAFVKKKDITLVHSQTRVTQVLACFLSRFSGIAYVSTCHGFFKKKRLGRRLLGAWGRFAIAISDVVREHLIKDLGVKKENVFLIYNGIDTKTFDAARVRDAGRLLKDNLGFTKFPVIGSVSRLSPVKGLRYLLFAMKDLLKDMPEAQLLLVGDGPSKESLLGLARKLGIESNVFFAQSTMQTEKFLSIMDIFVFYSLEEGLGLSLLEALAAEKPCVASDVGGVSSIIENNVTGILVPPRDAHLLKEGIVKLLKDPKLASGMARNGRELVQRKFSLEGMVARVVEVYERAINE